MQTKASSFIESCANIAIGYTVAIISQTVIFPWFDVNVSMRSHLLIGVWFTVVSLVRSYCLRRFFNSREGRGAIEKVAHHKWWMPVVGFIADLVFWADFQIDKLRKFFKGNK